MDYTPESEQKFTELHHIQHCDEENCCLGTAEFECPSCGEWNVKYDDLFYEEYEIWAGKELETCCESCDAILVAFPFTDPNDNNWKTLKIKLYGDKS